MNYASKGSLLFLGIPSIVIKVYIHGTLVYLHLIGICPASAFSLLVTLLSFLLLYIQYTFVNLNAAQFKHLVISSYFVIS